MRARTSTEAANLGVATRVWQAVAAGDGSALASALAEKAVLRSRGDNALSGEVRGRDLVIGRIAEFGDHVDDLRLSLRELFAGSSGAVIHYDLWARRGDQVHESQVLVRLGIAEGVVQELDVVPVDQARFDAFMNWIH